MRLAAGGGTANGNPTLPLFNVYGADLKTVQFCCTSALLGRGPGGWRRLRCRRSEWAPGEYA